ncbi:DUF262 domain-containing protein [Streptococcus sobrinus]|uniref:DUF262 domain-containing protein n=2 Tax=Streptococcus sobrinus TaxID=1310 RepID=UPI0002BF2D34|nr:DUF262 domain-containing protein [Streptococcus sobrinus]EMP72239.1 hypothetical protein D823_04152 [Streptococcus sobrinus DSM 20742 = ATCC 33478]SQG12995.1 Uncharacterized conserved protein [Streptococcus sobrinus]
MAGNLESLDTILRENLLRIPDYQRGYSWGAKEVQDFWDDLELIVDGREHYAGVLTFEEVPAEIYSGWEKDRWLITDRRMKPYYIVDGQQRLTTAIILLVSILKATKENFSGSLLDSNRSLDSIYGDYLFQEKDCNKTYKFSYDQNNDSLGYYISKILEEPLPVNTNLTIEDNEYSANLSFTKDFFEKKCRALSFSKLDKLFSKLIYSLVFNKYVIDKELDIFVTFETMNNRGKPLSKLELLKNRLIYLTMLIDTNDSAKANLREQINQCWKNLYRNLGKKELSQNGNLLFKFRSSNNLDDLFLNLQIREYQPLRDFFKERKDTNHFSEGELINSLLGDYFTAKNVIDKKIGINDLRKYIDDLSKKIIMWVTVNNPLDYIDSVFDFEEARVLNGIKILLNTRRSTTGSSFLFHAIFPIFSIDRVIFSLYSSSDNCTSKQRVTILRQIEQALLIRLYLGNLEYKGRTDRLFSFTELREFSTLLEEISKKEVISYDEFILQLKQTVSKLKTAFISGTFFSNTKVDAFLFYKQNKRVAKYILYNMEADLIERSHEPEYKNRIRELYSHFETDFYNIEHIYPKAGHNSYWNRQFGKLDGKEKDRYKNCLANLLLIGKKKMVI